MSDYSLSDENNLCYKPTRQIFKFNQNEISV